MSKGFGAIVASAVVGTVIWAFTRAAPEAAQVQKITYARQPTKNDTSKAFFGSIFDTVMDIAASGGFDQAGAGSSTPIVQPTKVSGPTSSKSAAGVDFAAYEHKYGLPTGYLYRTAQIESRLNPNAKNPRSSAGGLFQFINSTAKAYGLSNRYDPVQATDAASRLARDNANALRPVLGREPTAAELYLAHQQGAGGAKKILRDPNARAVNVVGSQQVKLHGGNSNMTASEFANLWIGKFNKGYK